mmetsp:Transcript_14903/g.40177  ORF Transcript_14903/g.40177 Transcript_14903/m.40177 type:complete len:118 (-) Transcript_14903:404-757(-)
MAQKTQQACTAAALSLAERSGAPRSGSMSAPSNLKAAGSRWGRVMKAGQRSIRPRVTTRSISSTNDGCEDTQDKEQCLSWAFFGECEKNPGYMLTNCRKSCKQCGKDKGARVITQST